MTTSGVHVTYAVYDNRHADDVAPGVTPSVVFVAECANEACRRPCRWTAVADAPQRLDGLSNTDGGHCVRCRSDWRRSP